MKKFVCIILTIIFSIFIVLFFTTRITNKDKKELKPIFKILKEDYIFDDWKLKIKFAKKDKYDNKKHYYYVYKDKNNELNIIEVYEDKKKENIYYASIDYNVVFTDSIEDYTYEDHDRLEITNKNGKWNAVNIAE